LPASASHFCSALSESAAFKALLVWEEFSAGLAYPLAEPGIILALCALACLTGQSWPQTVGKAIGVFALAALAGIAAVRLGWTGDVQHIFLLAAVLMTAIVAAAAPGRAQKATVVLTVVGGFLTGAASTPVLLPLRVSLPAVAGALAGSVLALALLAYTGGRFRRRFGGAEAWIGLRIAAAWVAAIAAMMLALRFSG
jgi:hypothetical protein